MSRFNYIPFDAQSQDIQAGFKKQCETLEQHINQFIGVTDSKEVGRYKARAITALEDMFTHINKAIKEDQIARVKSDELRFNEGKA